MTGKYDTLGGLVPNCVIHAGSLETVVGQDRRIRVDPDHLQVPGQRPIARFQEIVAVAFDGRGEDTVDVDDAYGGSAAGSSGVEACSGVGLGR